MRIGPIHASKKWKRLARGVLMDLTNSDMVSPGGLGKRTDKVQDSVAISLDNKKLKANEGVTDVLKLAEAGSQPRQGP